jgi:hypothetical protein
VPPLMSNVSRHVEPCTAPRTALDRSLRGTRVVHCRAPGRSALASSKPWHGCCPAAESCSLCILHAAASIRTVRHLRTWNVQSKARVCSSKHSSSQACLSCCRHLKRLHGSYRVGCRSGGHLLQAPLARTIRVPTFPWHSSGHGRRSSPTGNLSSPRSTVTANPSVKGTSCGKPQAAPYLER